MRQTLLAVAHCHRVGVAHRNIKPKYILIARKGASGAPHVKLGDFNSVLWLGPQRAAGEAALHGADDVNGACSPTVVTQPYAARNSARNSAQLARRNSPTPHIPPRSQVSLLAGAFYYLYNEVAFLALGRVNPVTHAVGNTIKRVVIIIASVIAFKTPISTLGVIGSTIAIIGTLLYSLAKSKFG